MLLNGETELSVDLDKWFISLIEKHIFLYAFCYQNCCEFYTVNLGEMLKNDHKNWHDFSGTFHV